MEQALVIGPLDDTTTQWIEQEAQRTGKTIEAVVLELIYRGLAVEREREHQARYHDLDALAGTWSVEEADEFLQATADLAQIDAALWQ